MSRKATPITGNMPLRAGPAFAMIPANFTGKTMQITPMTSDSYPMTVTTSGQPPVHRLCKYTMASPGTKAA